MVLSAVLAVLAVAATVLQHSQRLTAAPLATGGGRAQITALERLEALPAQGQGAISSALGARSQRFAARAVPGGWRLSGGGVSGVFRPHDAILRAGGIPMSVRLSSVARGEQQAAVGRRALSAAGNRLSYRFGGLTESFASGPLGIEQTFALEHRPAGSGPALTLELAVGGELRARPDRGGLRFLSPSGAVVLRYGGLVAIDASGRRLPAQMSYVRGSIRLRVADRGARYPLSIDPFIQEGPTLGATGSSGLGVGVAISADGRTALIGAPGDGAGAGAALVFVRSGGVWTQQGQPLTPSCSGLCQFGATVALSQDGSTALIGAPADSSSAGSAYVFTRFGSVWSKQTELFGDCTSNCSNQGTGELGAGYFGDSVTLSASGSVAVIGAPADHNDIGAAWVFTRTGGTWTQQTKLVAGSDETSQAQFGLAVALSQDGSTVLIGGPYETSGSTTHAGATWVFVNTGQWGEQARLVGSCTTNCANQGTGELGAGYFGWSVAMSIDGSTALIGAPQDGSTSGAAWVFTRSATAWSQQTRLAPSCPSCQLGSSVALSGDGSTALLGAPADAGGFGSALLFTRTGATWAQQGPKIVANCTAACNGQGTGETDAGSFGFTVSLSSDGAASLIAAPDASSGTGFVWVFGSPPTASIVAPQNGATYTQGQAIDADFTCAPGVSTASVTSCSGTVASGQMFDTSTPGVHSFQVTATDGDGQVGTALSTYTVAPSAPGGTQQTPAPQNTALPQITGMLVAGRAVTGSTGSWTGSPIAYDFQYFDCDLAGKNCTAIPGATSMSYTLASPDVGHTIRLQVTAGNAGGETQATSAATPSTVIAAPSRTPLLAVGAGAGGGPEVKVFDTETGATVADLFAFAPSFTGGVEVNWGDFNGDGVPDLIVGAGPGGPPEVKVIDGSKLGELQADGEIYSGALLADFLAFAPSFTGGVRVASADFNGDGRADLVVAPGPGAGPQVKVFSLAGPSPAQLASFFAFNASFTGGVRVAAGEVNGVPQLVAGAGSGSSQVAVFNGSGFTPAGQFFAFSPAFTGGVRVGFGDVNGDGKPDVVVGAGPGAGAEVKVFDAAKLTGTGSGAASAQLGDFFPFAGGFSGGVNVAASSGEIAAGAGKGASGVRLYSGAAGHLLDAFDPFPAFTGGVSTALYTLPSQSSPSLPAASTPSVATGAPSTSGTSASVPVGCDGGSGASCDVTATLTVTQTPIIPTSVGVFDPSTGVWTLRTKSGNKSFSFGQPGWIPVTGDWTGSGTTGIGVVDPSTGTWYLRSTPSAGAPDAGQFQFGAPHWIPVTGDWSGSGRTGIGMVDPTTETWYLRGSTSAGGPTVTPFTYGLPGWTPVTGDWTGSGKTSIGVFDPTTGTWYLRSSASAGAADAGSFRFGATGWTPVSGDWTGAGMSEIGVLDPSTATWYLRAELGSGGADAGTFAFGAPHLVPVLGNWGGATAAGPAHDTAGAPAATAAARKRAKKPQRKPKLLVLGRARTRLAAGQSKRLKVTLNRAGLALLKKHHKLKVHLTLSQSGRTISERTVVFRYRAPKKAKKKPRH